MGTVLLSILLTFVAAGAVMTVHYSMNSSQGLNGLIKDKKVIANAIAAGIIIGLVNFFTGKIEVQTAWVSFIMFGVLLAAGIMLIYYWRNAEATDELKPVWALVGLALFVGPQFLMMKSVATIATIVVTDKFWGSVVTTIPFIVMIIEVGCLLYELADFYCEKEG